MGLAQPVNIRTTIAKNREELEGFGLVHAVREPYTSGTERTSETTAYYLNEEQALLIVSLSRTEVSKKLRAEMARRIKAFSACIDHRTARRTRRVHHLSAEGAVADCIRYVQTPLVPPSASPEDAGTGTLLM